MKEKKSSKHGKHSKSEHKHKKKHNSDKHRHSKSKKPHKDKKHDHEGRQVDVRISAEDYFTRSEEFRVWLKLDRHRPFEEFDSEHTHKLFQQFCDLWNDGKLADMYYTGIPPQVRHECMRTQHKWGIKLSEHEKAEITELSDRVDINTRKPSQNSWFHMAAASSVNGVGSVGRQEQNLTDRRRTAGDDDAYAREEERERHLKQRKVEKKQERKRRDVVLEEVAPKETGRDAMIDKKREVSSRMRGAAADRDDAMDGLSMSESAIMGGGDDFSSVKARMERGRERRDEKKHERIRELQEKEIARQQSFMSQLGVDLSAGPIRIAPRNDS